MRDVFACEVPGRREKFQAAYRSKTLLLKYAVILLVILLLIHSTIDERTILKVLLCFLRFRAAKKAPV
jgi:hypothetical protein